MVGRKMARYKLVVWLIALSLSSVVKDFCGHAGGRAVHPGIMIILAPGSEK